MLGMIEIIEDASPYFVRLKHPGLEDVIDKCLFYIKEQKFGDKGFTHYRFSVEQARDILATIPFKDAFVFSIKRVSLFVTAPGHYYRAHKDGFDHRFSVNYTVKILDDKCVTSWYSDKDLEEYDIESPLNKASGSRECEGFEKSKYQPIKTMTAKPGECILFNTDIFHDFDNSQSANQRIVLTLREFEPGKIYFEDAKARILNTGR